MDALDQAAVDQVLLEADGTPNKGKLGANAILGVSMAVARAAADAVGLPLWRYLGGVQARVLPTPLMNILNGGVHADNGLEIQEFMIVPRGLADLRRGAPRRRRDLPHAEEAPEGQGLTDGVGDEGGFAPQARVERGGRRSTSSAPSRRPATSPARTSSSRSTARRASSSTRRPASTPSTRRPITARRARRHLREARREVPDRLASRTAARRTTGTAGSCSPTRIGAKRAARRRRPLRHQRRAPRAAASRAGTPTPSSSSSTRSARSPRRSTPSAWRPKPATARSSATARARPKTRSSPTSPSPPTPARSRPGSLSRSDRVAKYNQLLRIGFELGDGAVYAGHDAVCTPSGLTIARATRMRGGRRRSSPPSAIPRLQSARSRV